MPTQPVFVLYLFCAAIRMHDCIVPSRDDFAVFGFGGIPIGSDITLRALEDHKCLVAAGDVFPMRIGSSEMTLDNAVGSFILEHGWEMARSEEHTSELQS